MKPVFAANIIHAMGCGYQLPLPERINTYAESNDEGIFLRDEGSIWRFVSLRIQGCFPKNVYGRMEESESAHCIASILYQWSLRCPTMKYGHPFFLLQKISRAIMMNKTQGDYGKCLYLQAVTLKAKIIVVL